MQSATVTEDRRCGAMTRAGLPCRGRPVTGRDRCRMHGGTQQRGLAHPRWRHGRYSLVFTGSLLEAYQQARQDPTLIALDDELAAYNTILPDLLQRAQIGESSARWLAIREAYDQFMVAKNKDDALSAKRAIDRWGELSADGVADAKALRDWFDAVEGKRRISDTERRRLEALHLYASKEEVVAWFGAVAMVLIEEVHDLAVLGRVLARLEQIAAPARSDRGGDPDDA